MYTTEVPSSLWWKPSQDDPKPDELTVLNVPADICQLFIIEINDICGTLEWF